MKIKHLGDKYGDVQTILPNSRGSRHPEGMNAQELAQIFVDLISLPQPKMRQTEPQNLARLIYSIGRKRYGPKFDRLSATKLVFGDTPAVARRFC